MMINRIYRIALLLLLAGVTLTPQAQMVAGQERSSPDSNAEVEKLAAEITASANSEKERAYAIYSWVARNIEYDYLGVENVTLGFESTDVVGEALKKRKGVCQHYAELFHALAVESDLTSIVIFGYTRQNGKIDKVPHAWNALMVDSTWHLFDPTWGSGYFMNEQYRKEFTEKYFMVEPEILVKSHMPFDPLFQFLEYPVGHNEFKRGKPSDKSHRLDYRNEILRYMELDEETQLAESMERVQEFGIANTMVRGYYSNLNRMHQVFVANRQIDLHNQAIEKLNELVIEYNNYVDKMNARAGRFPADTQKIEAQLESMEKKAEETMAIFEQVDAPTKLAHTLAKNMDNLEKLLAQLRKEQERLRKHNGGK